MKRWIGLGRQPRPLLGADEGRQRGVLLGAGQQDRRGQRVGAAGEEGGEDREGVAGGGAHPHGAAGNTENRHKDCRRFLPTHVPLLSSP